MFPDPTIEWQPYPSIIDGIGQPFAFDRGLVRGILRLLIVEAQPGVRAYGVEVDCVAYAGFEEMIYSVAKHGDTHGTYDGDIYLKEARSSRLLTDFKHIDPLEREARHFLFVGGDRCYETLGFSAPTIRAFDSIEDAYSLREV